MPDSVPNYLTVDPVTGAVGAEFTGRIKAQGIDLDSDKSNPHDQIRWVDLTDFAATILESTDAGLTHRSDWTKQEPNGRTAQLLISTFIDRAIGYNKPVVEATADSGTALGGSANVRIIDSDGASDFLQLRTREPLGVGYGRMVINTGAVAAGGTIFTGVAALALPRAVKAAVAYITDGGALQFNFTADSTYSYTNNGFAITVTNRSGAAQNGTLGVGYIYLY